MVKVTMVVLVFVGDELSHTSRSERMGRAYLYAFRHQHVGMYTRCAFFVTTSSTLRNETVPLSLLVSKKT